jgi:hypothetical protein
MKNLLALLALLISMPVAAQQVVDAGQQSGIKDARFVVVRTADEYAAIFKDLKPSKAAPAVNFADSIVVGVFLGQQRTAGTKVKLTLITDPADSARLVVMWEGVPAPQKGFTAQVVSTPYELRAVPKKYAAVSFERDLKVKAIPDTESFGFDCR